MLIAECPSLLPESGSGTPTGSPKSAKKGLFGLKTAFLAEKWVEIRGLKLLIS
jgi:hypothetical protein